MIDEFNDEDLDMESISNIDDTNTINVTEFSDKKLCDIIVCYRYLGLNKELSENCMIELGLRRSKGNDFDFESYIENTLKEMPVLNFQLPDIGDVLRQLGGKLI